jgi:hypothetical protein
MNMVGLLISSHGFLMVSDVYMKILISINVIKFVTIYDPAKIYITSSVETTLFFKKNHNDF